MTLSTVIPNTLLADATNTPMVTLVVIVLNFLLIHLAPGDVSIILAGETADPAYLATIRERYGLDRPFLHCAVIELVHPRTRERLRFESPPAADLAAVVAALGGDASLLARATAP